MNVTFYFFFFSPPILKKMGICVCVRRIKVLFYDIYVILIFISTLSISLCVCGHNDADTAGGG